MRSSAQNPSPAPPALVPLFPGSERLPALFAETAAVDSLRVLAIDALNALPRRGLEIGGPIIGCVRNTPPTEAGLVAQEFINLEISHQFGPSYQIGEDEAAEFRQRFFENGSSESRRILGFWRTDTSGQALTPSPADQDLVRSLFGEGPAILLLMCPHRVEPFLGHVTTLLNAAFAPGAEFTIPTNNEPVAEPGSAANPKLEPAAQPLRSRPIPADSPSIETPVATQIHNLPEIPKPRPDISNERPPIRLRFSLGSVAAGATVAGATFLLVLSLFLAGPRLGRYWDSLLAARIPVGSAPVPAAQPAPQDAGAVSQSLPLEIFARRTNQGLVLGWRREGEGWEDLRTGVVRIRETNLDTRIQLGRQQLESGQVSYMPQSESLRIDVELTGDSSRRSGSLQLLVAEALPAAAREADSPLDAAPGQKTSRESLQASEPRTRGDRAPANRPPAGSAVRSSQRPGAASRLATRTFNTSDLSAAANNRPHRSGSEVISPPAIQQSQSSPAPGATPPLDSVPVPAPPPPQAPAKTEFAGATGAPHAADAGCTASIQTLAFYEPRSRFGFVRALGRLPFLPGGNSRDEAKEFVNPLLFRQRCPDLESVQILRRPPSVEFLVQLDANGAVEKVEATGPQQHTLVSKQTGEALKTWGFRPAQLDGKPVTSELRVTVGIKYPVRDHSASGQ